MKKILAIGASSSRKSINTQFAQWAAGQLEGVDLTSLDLNDYEMPIFSIDREHSGGIPQPAHDFLNQIRQAHGIILSLAEHKWLLYGGFQEYF